MNYSDINHYQSSARNKLLVEAFYLTKDIEKYGTGYIRIRNEISSYPTMKFDYKEMGNGYLVELYYSKQKTSLNVPENVPETRKKYSKKERIRIILSLIAEKKNTTLLSMSKTCSVDLKTIKRDIEELKRLKVISRIGPDRGGNWEINNDMLKKIIQINLD